MALNILNEWSSDIAFAIFAAFKDLLEIAKPFHIYLIQNYKTIFPLIGDID
jgi:hypothetical protein